MLKTKITTKLVLEKDSPNFYVFRIKCNPTIPDNLKQFWVAKNKSGWLAPEVILARFKVAYQDFILGNVLFK